MPVGQLLGRDSPDRPRWRAALRWRDWSLPVKLGAVTLIPIVIALVLGGITLTDHIERSDRYERQDRLAELGADGRTLLDALQRERTLTAAALTEGVGLDSPELRTVRGEVDNARAPLDEAARRAAEAGASIAGPRTKASEQLDRLPELRKEIGAGRLGAVEAVTAYTEITTALLELDTAVVAGIGADRLGPTADALHDLLVAREEVAVQRALVGYGIALGLTPSDYNMIRTSEVRRDDRLAEFAATATERQRNLFDSTVRGGTFDEYVRIVDAVLSGQDAGSEITESVTEQHWTDTSGAVFTAMGDLTRRLGAELTDGADAAATGASESMGLLAVLLFVALVLAAVVVFLITRQLLRSLRVLRSSALAVAEHNLPEAVRTIQEGHSHDTEVQPVPVHTRDEIGEVARAFDVVHSAALRLAAEQAGLRAGYAGMFVNLSRRSQSLVQRQLQLIERLERDEEDADQLATLFQLDHLATRMRRNNENLMVLSGAEPGRRSGQPVSATDVLRAAVSEIEQYQRVTVRTPPAVSVVGYAAGDLIRLVAELLDNATAFSAPETQVTVATGRMDDGSLSIDILDKGIGMNEAEVAEANERLTEAGSVDLTTSRRMGLFVVGRLASRHGFGVVLHGGKDIVGVRATVTVPADVVTDQNAQHDPDRPGPAMPDSDGAHAGADAGVDAGSADSRGQAQGGPLPRRKPGGDGRSADPRPAAGGVPPVPEPTDSEMSGTALFTPIDRDESEQEAPRGAPQARRWSPPPAGRPDRPDRTGAGHRQAAAQHAADRQQAAAPEWPSEADSPEHADNGGVGNGRPPRSPRRAPDETRPDERELSGRRLFEANSTAVSDWWSAAVTESSAGTPTEAQRRARQAAVDNAETTPIFDEMVSAWFRKVTDAAGSGQPERGDWDFAADESWRAVREVSQRSSPQDFTEAGLPRRRRGERLLPGSAAPSGRRGADSPGERGGTGTPTAADGTGEAGGEESGPSLPARNPAEVMGRLSSFQQGVYRGRRHRGGEQRAAERSQDERSGERERTGQAAAERRPPLDTETASGLPRRRRRAEPGHARSEPDPSETTDIVSNGMGALFVDPTQGERGEPAETTEMAGLAEPGEQHEHGGPGGSEKPDFAGAFGGGADEDDERGWAFPVDESWRTVREVSEATPSSYTSAGLPRRRRGERLLPGSAASEEASGHRPRVPRDPTDVRGRLTSFQEGVRRGRHRSAAVADVADENMEGE